ncbi:hypothetical protein INT47_011242 [Mucor saturninus]|uniref:Uncharacterized protein n=1 Tax=Mucor saturninus TaxID=64648 RepID=A0A8H7RM65_9FUNG|nr:hypothetical protein INT47_011242 [Mucor saturninus]
MWQQPLQPSQYPSYAYGNAESPIPQEASIEASFKRQKDGPVLWFAGPPLNVESTKAPIHSVSYLHWKQQQQTEKVAEAVDLRPTPQQQ